MKTSALIFIPVLALLAGSAGSQPERILDRKCGLEVTLPAPDWKKEDHGEAGVVVHVYSPNSPPVPRVTLMRFPVICLPEGLRTRARQVEELKGTKRVRLEEADLAGLKGEVYEYTALGTRTVEHGVRKGSAFFIVQVTALEEDWKNAKYRKAYESVFKSVRFLDSGKESLKISVDPKTPAQVRKILTPRNQATRTYAVLDHDVSVTLVPEKKRLSVKDDLVVEAIAQEVTRIHLALSNVQVDGISTGGKALEWEIIFETTLVVHLETPLKKGKRLPILFKGHSDEFFLAYDQKLVEEIAVLGQVLPESSFSSHLVYYPIDPWNDAPVRMALTVPDGYIAVTGGEPVRVESTGGRTTYHYATAVRTPRALPFGFAAGKFRKISDRTPGGLCFDLYFFQGKEKEARHRLAVLVESGTLFENLMGPLPWRRVAFCQVKPQRKETGVSLPGLVLFSDRFFQDESGVKLRGTTMGDHGSILFTDELSHQWNFYAVPLPNELAEGISTFTNLLYIEKQAGRGEYRAGIKHCADMYVSAAETGEDVALADPKLYRSSLYRMVAFCKVPAVLDLLRTDLGDAVFFKAWKHTFKHMRGNWKGYDAFEETMSKASGKDLRPFFDQWFFQAGHPRLEVTWRIDQKDLHLAVKQKQPGGLYDFRIQAEAETEAGKRVPLGPLHLTGRRQEFVVPVPGPVKVVRLDPGGIFPLVHYIIERARD